MFLRLFAATAAVLLPLATASAQGQAPTGQAPAGQAEMLKTMILAGHNQLGVLQYCQAQGSLGADVVALQRKMLGMMPPAPVEGTAEAEALGKRGVVSFAGSQTELAAAAKSQNTTVDAMCKQMGDMLTSQAANLPK